MTLLRPRRTQASKYELIPAQLNPALSRRVGLVEDLEFGTYSVPIAPLTLSCSESSTRM
jgi:hypothetical protein